MTTRLILTVSGSDRPGLTRSLADAVLAAGGNWLESHLSRLGGMYVGAVLVEIASDAVAALEAAVRGIDGQGLSVSTVAAGEEPPLDGMRQLGVELVGQDRPGIVREVTRVLANLGVNIEELDTGIENGAWSGERLFRAELRLAIPDAVTVEAVQQALETISGDMMVDFSFARATGPAASSRRFSYFAAIWHGVAMTCNGLLAHQRRNRVRSCAG